MATKTLKENKQKGKNALCTRSLKDRITDSGSVGHGSIPCGCTLITYFKTPKNLFFQHFLMIIDILKHCNMLTTRAEIRGGQKAMELTTLS